MLCPFLERTACQHPLRITWGRLVIRPPIEDILVLLGTHLEGPLLKGLSAHVPGHRLGLGHEVAFKMLPAPRRKNLALREMMTPRRPATRIFAVVCLLFAHLAHGNAQNASSPSGKQEEARALLACPQMLFEQARLLKIPSVRDQRFQDKLPQDTVLCRGGDQALQFRGLPWVDWGNYWGTGDLTSMPTNFLSTKLPAFRGVTGALLDLELQRMELIKFNLFDNSGTYQEYVQGLHGRDGP